MRTSSVLIATAAAALSSSPCVAGVADIKGCPTKVIQYGWYGKPDDSPDCTECTVVTYITGQAPGCAPFKDWVVKAEAKAAKCIIPMAAGFVAGCFDTLKEGVWWIELGTRDKYGPVCRSILK